MLYSPPGAVNIEQIDVRFLCVCPVIDHEFRHNILCYDEIHCQYYDYQLSKARQSLVTKF